MTLQQRLDAYKAPFESGAPLYNAPREAIEIMHRATEDLGGPGWPSARSRLAIWRRRSSSPTRTATSYAGLTCWPKARW